MKNGAHSWVVDSLEENTAAVEQDGGTVYQIPRFLLPPGALEGDVCKVTSTHESTGRRRAVNVEIDEKATQAARKRSADQLAVPAKKHDPGGPIKL